MCVCVCVCVCVSCDPGRKPPAPSPQRRGFPVSSPPPLHTQAGNCLLFHLLLTFLQPINGPFLPGQGPIKRCPAHQLPTVAEAGLRPRSRWLRRGAARTLPGGVAWRVSAPGSLRGYLQETGGHVKLEGGCVQGLSPLGRAGSVLRAQPGPNPPSTGLSGGAARGWGGPEGGAGLRSPASSVLDTGPPRA